MGFFFQQTKSEAVAAKAASRQADKMPKETLNRMGCDACPRNKVDCQNKLKHPKMQYSGAQKPLILVLGNSPTAQDDKIGEFLTGKDHEILYKQIPSRYFDRDVAMLGLSLCAGEPADAAVIECCRNKVLAEIEAAAPLVVITIGKEALEWATGFTGGPLLRSGHLIPTWFGKHTAWVLAVPDSDWRGLKPGKYGPSKYFLVYKQQMEEMLQKVYEDNLDFPVLPRPEDFAKGVECISGQNPGDIDRLESALERMAQLPDVGIDYETDRLRPYQRAKWGNTANIWCCSVGTLEHTVAFSLDMPDGWPTAALRRRAWDAFTLFLTKSGKKIAHNLSMEQAWTAYKVDKSLLYSTDWEDTMAQAHTLDERKGTKSLNDCIRMHFGFFLKDVTKVDPVRLLEYPMSERLVYNALDTKWSHALYHKQKEVIDQTPNYVKEYNRKVDLTPALVLTELEGLPCDDAYARAMMRDLQTKSKQAEDRIQACPEVRAYTSKFGKFSPTSPDQVLRLYKDVLRREEVEVQSEEGTTYTTNEDALAAMPAKEVPSAPLILQLRQSEKLVSTYLEPIVEKRIVHDDGCMHPIYNSMVAVTGRLSSEDPNGQNWPKRKNKEIRGVVVPPEGRIVVAKDYGQIEARVIGMASEDKNLVKALWTGYDIHAYWANRVFDLHPKWFDFLAKEFNIDKHDEKALRKCGRQEAKNKWVFPQFFGSSYKSCANDLHIPVGTAEDLMNEFWDEFRGVKAWQDKTLKFYDKHLYVETLTGRRRRGAMSKNEVINMPIQGTAADIVTKAMEALSLEAVIRDDMSFHPRLNVHDDLTSMPLIENLEQHVQDCARIMCAHRFDFVIVPLVVEVETGPNWYKLTKYGEYRSDTLFNLENPYV